MTLLIFLITLIPQDPDLRKENARLRDRIRVLEKQLEAAEAQGFVKTRKNTISSFLAAVKDLPDGLELRRESYWSEPQIKLVAAEIANKNGKFFDAKLVVKSLRFKPTDTGYNVLLAFEPQTFAHRGHAFSTYFGSSLTRLIFEFSCSPEDHSELKKIKTGREATVNGTIVRSQIRKKTISVELKRVSINGVAIDF